MKKSYDPYDPDPLILTDDEIAELNSIWTKHYGAAPTKMSWDDGRSWLDYDPEPPKFFTPHEWVPVLLLTTTVYSCKHCGAAREKTKGVYCEEETEF